MNQGHLNYYTLASHCGQPHRYITVDDSFDFNDFIDFIEGEMESHGHRRSKQFVVAWMSFKKGFLFEIKIIETLTYGEVDIVSAWSDAFLA